MNILTGFLMAVLAGLFLAGFGVAISIGVRKRLDMFQFLFWNAFMTAILAMIYPGRLDIAFAQGVPRFGELVWWIVGGGVCSISGSLFVQRAMKHGSNNLVWAIQQAGLLLPFLSGILFFRQSCGVFQIFGVGLIVAGLFLPSGECGAKNGFLRWFPFALGAFLFMGLAEAMQSVPSYWNTWQDTAVLRPSLAYAGGSLGSAMAALFLKRKLLPVKHVTMLFAAGVAVWNVFTVICMFKALDICSVNGIGSIGFPVMIGASILFFAAYSVFVIREKNTARQWGGLAAILAGVVIISLR